MMDLEIRAVHGHGNHTEERVHMVATAKCNLAHYMLADSTYLPNGKLSNKLRHTYWGLDLELNRGDSVVLYTRDGDQSKRLQPDGSTVHFLYWGLHRAVWNDAGDLACLIWTPNWKATRTK